MEKVKIRKRESKIEFFLESLKHGFEALLAMCSSPFFPERASLDLQRGYLPAGVGKVRGCTWRHPHSAWYTAGLSVETQLMSQHPRPRSECATCEGM